MSNSSEVPEYVLVVCKRCACRLHPYVRTEAYHVKCPDCYEPVRVPPAAEVLAKIEREKPPERDIGTYKLSLPPDMEARSNEAEWASPTPESAADRPAPTRRPKEQPKKPVSSSSSQPPAATPADVPTASVTCPACQATFEPPRSDQPQLVLCPECLEDVPVPASRAEQPPPVKETPPKKPAGGSASKRPESSPELAMEFAAWDPSLDEAEPEPVQKRTKKRRPKPADDRVPAQHPTTLPAPKSNVFDVMAQIRQVEDEPPPAWTFFSGVVDFLFRPQVAGRWAFASVGFCVLGWLCAFCFNLYVGGNVIVIAFFALPTIWVAMWTLSYTAACGMSILLETAAGNDKIDGWPEPVMKEWAVHLVYLGFLMLITQVLSYTLGNLLAGTFGPVWSTWLVVAFLLYPVVVLSSLEANSSFVPFTGPILKSLVTTWWGWLTFHGMTGGLLAVVLFPLVGGGLSISIYTLISGLLAVVLCLLIWGGLSIYTLAGGLLAVVLCSLIWGGMSNTYLTMILVAPMFAGWCFLYARLLGRLAWRASLDQPEAKDSTEDAPTTSETQPKAAQKRRKPKRKQLKPRAPESSGELHAAR